MFNYDCVFDYLLKFWNDGDVDKFLLAKVKEANASPYLLQYNYNGEHVCKKCFEHLHNIGRRKLSKLSQLPLSANNTHHLRKYSGGTYFKCQREVFVECERLVQRDCQYALNISNKKCMPQGSWSEIISEVKRSVKANYNLDVSDETIRKCFRRSFSDVICPKGKNNVMK